VERRSDDQDADLAIELARDRILRDIQIVVKLQVRPELRLCPA
jgi:hypothetical protein